MRKRIICQPKVYRGYMKFPLSGAETAEQFATTCTYVGSFADKVKRVQIFSRPRKFRLEIHLKHYDKPEWNVSEYTLPKDKLSHEELAILLYQLAVQDLRETKQEFPVDVEKSFFKVII